MKILLIVLAVIVLTSCSTTITIKPNGEVIVDGPRKATIVTPKVAVSTGQMLMSDETITALGTRGIQAITETPY